MPTRQVVRLSRFRPWSRSEVRVKDTEEGAARARKDYQLFAKVDIEATQVTLVRPNPAVLDRVLPESAATVVLSAGGAYTNGTELGRPVIGDVRALHLLAPAEAFTRWVDEVFCATPESAPFQLRVLDTPEGEFTAWEREEGGWRLEPRWWVQVIRDPKGRARSAGDPGVRAYLLPRTYVATRRARAKAMA